MRFCDWHALTELEAAPGAAGLFQLKISEGLLQYPNGKTAMFYYGYAENLRTGLQSFTQSILPGIDAPAELVLRWMPCDGVAEKFKKYLYIFESKFGSLPIGNEMLLRNQNHNNR